MFYYNIKFTLNNFQMGKDKTSLKKNMKISLNVLILLTQRRLKLIDLVQKQNMTVVKASKKLELKVCTARSILAKYQKSGSIFDKNMRKKSKNGKS